MEITYDPAKDAANIAKHSVSLAEASLLDWGTALVWPDARKDYGEPRQAALAVLVDRVYFVAFVDRADGRRVISLRKANQREFDRYVAYIDSSDR
jgi:uncharacterized DUF497 family protein